ncbi:methyltransferase domain-containing protein [Ramlibacter tataouinensis]|uniref:class I SAM-dependent methyltransferase n=1 Tax=Ramlibacter tataouinensis TaxID=94132 RepID=UPI0022F3E05A|nr:methyltransferase domain-containing protein [Ramlibacter tataouinensis]WBY03153.1 methyltransferase domain-containing protein [Ramlibacter tataouinensis]
MNEQSAPVNWQQGDAYERYIGRWSRQVAPLFLAWLDIPPGRRWLDVGCGTGALSAAILERCAPAGVTGVEPSDGFRALAIEQLGPRARVLPGSAEALPLGDASCDVAVSGLVLNFVPDVAAALAQMRRVVAPGGTIAAYVWDYADRMEVIRLFWEEAVSLDAEAARLHEGARFPLCHPHALKAAFEQAGLAGVEVVPLDGVAAFASFDDYWQPFLGGQGPAPTYASGLPESQRITLRNALQERLAAGGDGSIRLNARAWAVRGASPGIA